MKAAWIQPGITSLLLVVTVLTSLWVTSSGSHCDKDEIQSCKQAVTSGQLESFHTGGTCTERGYAYYTHICVPNTNVYDPSINSCCCLNSRQVMCCKLQDKWNLFRCSRPDDTIDNLSSFSSPDGSSPLKTPPLEILIPVILVPLILIGCCIFCAVKCCKKDPETKKRLCSLTCCRKTKQKQSKSHTSPSRQVASEQTEPASQPEDALRHAVTSQYSTESRGSEAKLLPGDNDPMGLPLSPPYTDGRSFQFSHAGYSRLQSNSSAILPHDPQRQNSELRELNSQFSNESKGSEAGLLPAMDDPVASATAPPDEETDFTCPHYSDDNDRMAYSGNGGRRSGGSMAVVMVEADGGGGRGRAGVLPQHYLPSVGYMGHPPAYSEHHKDPVLP